MSASEVSGIVGGLPVPVRSAPVVAVMIVIVIVIVIGVAIIAGSIVVISSSDREVSTAAIVDPDPIAMSSPCAPLFTWAAAQLSYQSQIVPVSVSGDSALLILAIGRAVERLCVRSCAGKNQHNRHEQ